MKTAAFQPKRRKRSRTILSIIMLPMLAILLVQSALNMVVFWRGNVFAHIEEVSFSILRQQVHGQAQALQSDMLYRWSDFSGSERDILALVESTLDRYGATAADIATDAVLNGQILEAVAPELSEVMRRNSVTGAFFILDGPAVSQQNDLARAALFLRSTDVGTQTIDSLQLVWGMPRIAQMLHIALAGNWSSAFEPKSEIAPGGRLFYVPLAAARQSTSRRSSDFAYWSYELRVGESGQTGVTCSIPLFDSDGRAFGVMGVEMSAAILARRYDFRDLAVEGNGAYCLGVSTDQGASYHRVIETGPLLAQAFAPADDLEVREAVSQSVYRLYSPDRALRDPLYGCILPLEIYPSNSPYEGQQQWALFGIARRSGLMDYNTRLRKLIMISMAVSLFMAMFGLLLVARRITRPITALVNNLRTGNSDGPIVLPKLDIVEVDELTIAIENLSRSVSQSSTRIASIFGMAQIAVGVFEYDRDNPQVFCSGNLFGILGWDDIKVENYLLMERSAFAHRLLQIDSTLLLPGEKTLRIEGGEGVPRWLRFHISEQEDKLLGAVMDVTAEVQSKRRIEFERDFDSLTSLYNRRAFMLRFEALLNEQLPGVSALLMWDLDNLKNFNDNYGHESGDLYIRALSECFSGFPAERSLLGRRSGDEFFTYLYGFESQQALRAAIDVVWQQVRQKVVMLPDGNSSRVHVSTGLVWGEAGKTAEELCRHADFAMYFAKHNHKGNIQEFSLPIYRENAYIINGYETITRLIEQSSVFFKFQPIVESKTGKVFGYEALMRSNLEGVQSPKDILRMAQAHSKLYPIERLSFFGAMERFVQLEQEGLLEGDERIFLNSIGNQILNDEDMALFEQQFAPYLHRVVAELTEGAPGNETLLRAKCDMAARWGGMIAIDDYGTGYNSEAALVFLSPQLVKIDMTIIRNIDRDENRRNVLESIISYTRKRNIAVLAEGIETAGELRVVLQHGVQYLQGYFIGRPYEIPAPVAPEALRRLREFFAQRERHHKKGDIT